MYILLEFLKGNFFFLDFVGIQGMGNSLLDNIPLSARVKQSYQQHKKATVSHWQEETLLKCSLLSPLLWKLGTLIPNKETCAYSQQRAVPSRPLNCTMRTVAMIPQQQRAMWFCSSTAIGSMSLRSESRVSFPISCFVLTQLLLPQFLTWLCGNSQVT